MTVDAICAIGVAGLAHDDCILWLWTTSAHHRDAYAVLDAWGFEHKTTLTWVKDQMGVGHWLRGRTEHCLMAVRGHPIVELSNQTTALRGPVRAHSQKPEKFYQLVERLCPASRYAYLFARDTRPGWDTDGDEILPEPPLTDSGLCGARTPGRCKGAARPGTLGGHDQGGAAAAGRSPLQTCQW
jgi:N6-adenosine-specific RNA methylase IME4